MRTHNVELDATTGAATSFVDITGEIDGAVEQSGIRDGQVTVFVPEGSCALIVNELESGLLADIDRALKRVSDHGPAIGSASVVLPAMGGRLRLGTWQRVLLVELEGAARRSVLIQIVGE
jgi:thiamine phosphate synthase YjbQ (UPF0047 family)